MHPSSIRLQSLALAVAAALSAPTAALAQQATPATTDTTQAKGDVISLDSVFVTGIATAKSKLKSSVSVSTVGAEAIEQSAPRSTAEIFRNIPGIRSESSGGEGNANIAVRGLPVASGGAKFLQLQEDGLPVLEFGDITFGNADIFLRSDYSLERIEAIRGGSASTFASNSPGGIINFISKTGDTAGGSVGLTRGLGGYDNTRLDFDYGAPFAEHWQFNIGGFYRRGDGVRDAGYTTDKGGQLKANLTRLFDNGYVRVYAKYLNDRAAGYLPVPTMVSGSDGSPHFGSINGFDPGTDTLYSPYFRSSATLDGKNRPSRIELGDGMHPLSRAFGAEAQFDVGSGWTLTDKFRIADTSGGFVSPFPAQVADAGALATSIGGAGAGLRYVDGPNAGQAYSGLALRTHLFNVHLNNLDNAVNDFSLARDFGNGNGGSLNLKAGWYTSRQTINADWTWNSYVLSLAHRARLLDVVAADGSLLSQNGLYAYGVPYWGLDNTRHYDVRYDINAPYLALSWDQGPLSVDGSLRYDMGRARGNTSGGALVSNVDVNGDGVIEAPERSVATIDYANRKPVHYDWNYLSYSFGGNYLINDDLAAFARYSRGARANADRLLFGVVRDDGSVSSNEAVNVVKQLEGGLKWRSGSGLSLFATAFAARTQEQNYEATTLRFFDRTYKAHGLELEAAYRVDGFGLNGGLTWTDATIDKDQITPANAGNTPRRQARFVWQLTPSYRGERYEVGVNAIGTTSAYTQDSNQLKMPGYTQVNLFADYRITDALTVSLNVNNVFNTFGLTEAEEASIADASSNIIRARSIPGRTSSISLRYDF
ncbi:TonB-dependent receptor [Xanthomonas albilineans]|uniref:Probable tonb-dependent outer membrane receptor sucrose transporter protein n=1 Tax=Xanthomonas albilineans (strain GPE PC73 / CFBP 7063) TaxID=380358 RepID=D2UBQ0_XANAP|nr:TonB-dependent receptor [Xanthomonas albilineans]QHQ27461.1 putative TonB-dependent outer membrane receptor sucrose transporter protein [Xanthomonas albilineans]CBA15249.1 probable tonb-dependent outer membrane receptor sucrose transporter protein [Xanthomonas albilineans GPE PC73]